MPNDKLKYLGQRMRETRQTAHLTQEELSLKSHVSVRQIAKKKTTIFAAEFANVRIMNIGEREINTGSHRCPERFGNSMKTTAKSTIRKKTLRPEYGDRQI